MYEGQLIEMQKEIAEEFNNHFTTLGPKLAEKVEAKEQDNRLKYFADEETIDLFINKAGAFEVV